MSLKKCVLSTSAFILLLIAVVSVTNVDRVIFAGPNEQSAAPAYTDWWDYTVDYVDRAIDLYDQRGLEAVREYYNSEASFEGEWYLFATDENDIYVVHPIFPRLIGTDIKDVVDSTGYELGKDIAKATEEGRRIEYLWPHPVTRVEAPKVAYAKRHDGYVFASGYYPVPGEPGAYTQGYVQKAIDLYDSDGLDAAVAHYNSRDSLDNQWYLQLVSVPDKTFLAHGLSPNLLGANVANLTDPQGFNFGQALLDAPEAGYWFQMAFPRGAEAGFTRIRVWAVRHGDYVFASGYFTGEVDPSTQSPTPTPTPTVVPTPTPTPEPIDVDEVIARNPFGLLVAIINDAYEGGHLDDMLVGQLIRAFIDILIAGNTGETTEQVVYRVAVQGPAADRAALLALYNATGGAKWDNSDNWLTDEPLAEWHGVTTNAAGRVTELDLNDNNLEGTLPPELGNLASLTSLNLRSNPLTGEIPPELGNLSNLKSLRLYRTGLSGELPRELANLSNLERLWVYSNELSGEIPTWLQELTNLKVLDLDDNNFTGEIPPELANLTQLKSLWLANNKLTGEIPPELGNLSKLEWLMLYDNSLTGEIPSELGNLSQLEWIYLSDNQLTGEVPPELGNLALLERIHLRNNEISGEIPPELGNLANLELLHIGSNELTGEIPAELGNLDSMAWIFLYENELTGVIPSELANLANLEILFLRHNQLKGAIPPELGNLAKLELLSLRNNRFRGAIPPELGDLASLESLTVSDNLLTGIIPAELGNLENLQTLWVRGNRLTGCIPAALQSVSYNDFDELDPPLPFCESDQQSPGAMSETASSLETAEMMPVKSLTR